jgi:hypothetical protein
MTRGLNEAPFFDVAFQDARKALGPTQRHVSPLKKTA